MNIPHGGKLINRTANKKDLDLDNIDLSLDIDSDQLSEITNIAHGLYSPLEGYLNEDDFNSVVDKMTLSNGVPWAVPIFLSVNKSDFSRVKSGSQVSLDYQGKQIAVLTVESKFEFDKSKFNQSIYGTTDSKHPGVARINEVSGLAVGGPIWVFGEIEKQYPEYDLTPAKVRARFEKMGWNTIVGFQTRNPAHRAHEFIQKMALEFVDGLFINPIIGKKKEGDFTDEVILKVYTHLINNYYPDNSSTIAIYNSRMNYAGPKEAVFHAIVRKNFGCTHFIVGRDHAGVGDYYDKFAAHQIFESIEGLDMEIMKVSNAFYCRRCELFTTGKICPHNNIYHVAPSGTQVRKFIQDRNIEPLRQIMRDEVLDIIFSFEQPFVQ